VKRDCGSASVRNRHFSSLVSVTVFENYPLHVQHLFPITRTGTGCRQSLQEHDDQHTGQTEADDEAPQTPVLPLEPVKTILQRRNFL
jgi:hypothetical protein